MPSQPMNILFILADQMRADAMGCMGNPHVRTPHLDALARRGALFTNAIANCPVCTPSRAMLMTGRYPISNRTLANDMALPLDQAFLAKALSDAGYEAGYIGKWHLDGIPREKFTPPGDRRAGFDAFWAAYNCHHDYFDAKYYLDSDALVKTPGYEPAVQVDLAMAFMAQPRRAPFFLMIAWGPPHDPYERVPESYRRMYDPADVPRRANCANADGRRFCDYYAQITAVDDQVGRLMAFLEARQLADRTLVVFTSDHGDMLYSHGRMYKQQPWEEAIHIPLIMRAPGILPAGTQSDVLFGMADFAPTLLAMNGVATPEGMEGLDLSRALAGDGPAHDSLPIMDCVPVDQAIARGGREWRGVRTKTHTYARYRDGGWVLYDNAADPFQMHNLIDRPEHRALQERMEAELQSWLARLNDRFLMAEEQLRALGQWEAFRIRNAHFPWSRKK